MSQSHNPHEPQTHDERANDPSLRGREHAPEASHSSEGDGVLDTLQDLESRLSALRAVHTQSAIRVTELARKEADLAQREASLNQREGQLGQREEGLHERESGLEQRTAEWRQTAEQVRAQQEKMAALEQALEAQRGQIESVRRALEQEAAETRERDQHSLEREQAIVQRERGLHTTRELIKTERESIKAEQQQISAARQELHDQHARLGGREDAVAQRERKAVEVEQFIAQQRGALEQRERELGERKASLDARERELDAAAEHLQAREKACEALERDLDQQRQELSAQSAKVSAESSRIERMLGEVDRRERELEQEAQRVRGAEDELGERGRELDERRGAFEHEVDVTRASLEKRERDIKELEAVIQGERESVQSKLAELDRERAAVTEQQRTLLAQSSAHGELGGGGGGAISSGRVEMLQIQIGEANAARASAEEALTQAQEECRQLRERLEQLEQMGDRSELENQIAKRDHAIMLLRERLSQAQTQATGTGVASSGADGDSEHGSDNGASNGQTSRSGRKQRGKASNGAAAATGASSGEVVPAGRASRDLVWIERRRARLARLKSLLQQQARKLVAAQNALQKRHIECEQILAQRQKLAAAAQEVARQQARVNNAKARSGAFMAILTTVLTGVVLAGASYFIALKVFPGRYVARAEIQADTRGREAQGDELGAWQSYHESLTTNPQFVEVAAERMARRGIATLARPADLNAKLRTDLFTQSSEPGTLKIEITERTPQRAELVLDTYIVALKSVSDAAREQRSDDLGVKILQVAQADTSPVNEDTLLGYAGGIFGGLALGVGLFGMLIYSRLVNAKRKFDRSQEIDEALSGVDWASLEASVKRPTLAAPAGGVDSSANEGTSSSRKGGRKKR